MQLALRLKVENQKVTEAEHLYAVITAPGQLANLQTPRPAFFATVPPTERSKRNILLLIGNAYYDALEQSNGEVAPFAAECGRRENGMHTAGHGHQQGRYDVAAANAVQPVRSRGGAHLQDQRREDPRDRSDGLHAAAVFEERLEPVPPLAGRSYLRGGAAAAGGGGTIMMIVGYRAGWAPSVGFG